MNKLTNIFLALAVMASAQAFAHPLSTLLSFECPPGPGYMKVVLVMPDHTRITKNWSIGSKSFCDVQKTVLDKTRTVILDNKLIAFCSETLPFNGKKSAYLTTYSVDCYGNFYYQSQTFYNEAPEECLKVATDINSR